MKEVGEPSYPQSYMFLMLISGLIGFLRSIEFSQVRWERRTLLFSQESPLPFDTLLISIQGGSPDESKTTAAIHLCEATQADDPHLPLQAVTIGISHPLSVFDPLGWY